MPAAASLKVGDPAEGDAIEMGPVVSAAQQQRVLGFLDRAASGGAHVLLGGSAGRDGGFFVEPTVVTGAAQDAEIIQSEVFGPVVTVQRVDSAEDAIRFANDVPYGLAASVWTRDVGHALQAVRALDFGLRLGQRPPPVPVGDAARRLQGIRLRQGPLHLRPRRLHAHQARDDQPRLRPTTAATATTARTAAPVPSTTRKASVKAAWAASLCVAARSVAGAPLAAGTAWR